MLAATGSCLLVDCHSFPWRPLPYEDDQDPDRPQICIGTDRFHTPSGLRDAAVQAFRDQGWRVVVDRPFSGALVPMTFFRKDPRVRAFMVEVNRELYMDERTGRRLASLSDVKDRIARALGKVAGMTGMGTWRHANDTGEHQ